MRYLAPAALVLACTLGTGCASSSEPLTPDAGVTRDGAVYVLRTAGGAGLPAVWISNEGVTITVLAETIRLREGGRGDRTLAPPHFVGRVTANGLVFDQALSYRTPLRYERVSR